MTFPRPKDLAASVRQRLLNRSRESTVDFQIILAQFGFERLLYRLSRSEHAGQFTIKGALMFLVWTREQYRPTRDLDLTTSRQLSPDELKAMFQSLCSLSVEEDGLVFPPAAVKVEPIREDSDFRRRKTILPEEVPTGLSDEFSGDVAKQTQWNAFIRRTPVKLPSRDLREVVTAIRSFLVPPMLAAGKAQSFTREWPKGGPWNG